MKVVIKIIGLFQEIFIGTSIYFFKPYSFFQIKKDFFTNIQ
jgi:hypothetical protein